MKKQNIQKQLKAFETQKESDIDYSEIPELGDDFFNVPTRKEPRKTSVSLRLDTDVLNWLKSFDENGKGYQTRANELLKKLMIAHRR